MSKRNYSTAFENDYDGTHVNKKMLYNENIKDKMKFTINSLPSLEKNLDELVRCQRLLDKNKGV